MIGIKETSEVLSGAGSVSLVKGHLNIDMKKSRESCRNLGRAFQAEGPARVKALSRGASGVFQKQQQGVRASLQQCQSP